MRAFRTSGSMSGVWNHKQVALVRHRQTKEPDKAPPKLLRHTSTPPRRMNNSQETP